MRRIANQILKNFVMLSVACVSLFGCVQSDKAKIAASGTMVPIVRLDQVLASVPDMDASEVDSMISAYGDALDFLFGILDRPVTDSTLMAYARSRAVSVFEPDIVRLLSGLDSVEHVLGDVKLNLKGYERLSMPEAYGIVSPYNQRIFMADSLMLIGLNHYLGPEYEGYAAFPDYQRRLKRIDRLPYDVVEALLVSAYPMQGKTGEPSTVLEHMLYQGALLMAILDIVPDATEGSVAGYDQAQYEWALDHEAQLWKAMISGELLYDVSPAMADRILSDSPSVSFIHPDAPGRIGRFIGLRIIRSYLDRHPGTEIDYLLSPDFYGNISTLAKSGYSPR